MQHISVLPTLKFCVIPSSLVVALSPPAFVLLWLLHGAIQGNSLNYSWHGLAPSTEPTGFADLDPGGKWWKKGCSPVYCVITCATVCAYAACLYDQTFCGCCLMTTQLERMKTHFEDAQRKMTEQMKALLWQWNWRLVTRSPSVCPRDASCAFTAAIIAPSLVLCCTLSKNSDSIWFLTHYKSLWISFVKYTSGFCPIPNKIIVHCSCWALTLYQDYFGWK